MGFGDELMAAGRAERLAKQIGSPVRIVGKNRESRWSDVWEGNPHITRDHHAPEIVDGPGARPYIRYPFTSAGHGYTDWRARDEPGHLYLSMKEQAFGEAVKAAHGRFVVIEPNVKEGSNVNKRWGKWFLMPGMLAEINLLQLGPAGTKPLQGARLVQTDSFRAAAAVLSQADALVTTEGGLHHAAAALGIPAVVIFGGSPSIEATGYPEHINLGSSKPCGRWVPCEHCRKAMDEITPEIVASSLRSLLDRN
jgi:hypothetical protein